MKSPTIYVAVAMSGDHNRTIFKPTVTRATRNVYDANTVLYSHSIQSCIRLQIGVSIRAVVTADALVTCYANY